VRRFLLLGLVVLAGCAGGDRPTLSDDTVPARACSADGLVVLPVDTDGIPAPVARRRQSVIDAAVDCDYATLRRIARHDGLVISIDGEVVPVGQWEHREADGQPILRPLAGILSLAHVTEGEGDARTFIWPTAVGWPFADVAPADERQALVDVVGEEGIFGWAGTGGYAGWRTSIDADGTWAMLAYGPLPGQGG